MQFSAGQHKVACPVLIFHFHGLKTKIARNLPTKALAFPARLGSVFNFKQFTKTIFINALFFNHGVPKKIAFSFRKSASESLFKSVNRHFIPNFMGKMVALKN